MASRLYDWLDGASYDTRVGGEDYFFAMQDLIVSALPGGPIIDGVSSLSGLGYIAASVHGYDPYKASIGIVSSGARSGALAGVITAEIFPANIAVRVGVSKAAEGLGNYLFETSSRECKYNHPYYSSCASYCDFDTTYSPYPQFNRSDLGC